jgi:DNA (cytosine-5)-methyltransferase 1
VKSRPVTVLDAFAGAGGFSLGFQLAGATIIGGIERDAWAAETFAFNHPEASVLVKDIELLSDEEIVDLFGNRSPSIVIGGPPCQGFSVCRRRDAGDPLDPRNSLFEEFIRLGRALSPEMMVMENVPNLLQAKTAAGEPVIDIICQELQGLGYHTYFDVLQAVDYGIPQIRKRLFVIASRTALDKPFPDQTHTCFSEQQSMFSSLQPTSTLWDAISDLPPIKAGEGAVEMDYGGPPQNSYQAEMRNNSPKVFNHTAMRHSKRMVERFAVMKCGDSVTDVPDHLKPFARNSNGLISAKAYDQNNRRMHPDRPCHTIPAAFYANFVHPFYHRNFTPREGARLQSFPDWYVFKGKPTVVSHKLLAREERWSEKFLCQYNQIGNAVPPLLAKAVAQNLLQSIDEDRGSESAEYSRTRGA